jgi:GTP cyclohydrolase I
LALQAKRSQLADNSCNGPLAGCTVPFNMNKPLDLQAVMPDVQSTPDFRQLAIQHVGVRAVRHPVQVRMQGGEVQHTVATWSLDVALPATQKGTHMSRFVELLMAHDSPLDVAALRQLAADMLKRLQAADGRIAVRFPFFIRKSAPVSGVQSYMDYEAGFDIRAQGGPHGDHVRVDAYVLAPVKSLCPCSKEISEYGAHNQRSHLTISAELKGDITIEELIRYAEEEASSEIWGLLKRPDEKFITEKAYENPKFVEDFVRDVAGRLNADSRIGGYVLEAENFESIHNHSAYARIVKS